MQLNDSIIFNDNMDNNNTLTSETDLLFLRQYKCAIFDSLFVAFF